MSLLGGIMVVCLDALDVNEEWLWWMPVVVVVLLRFVALYLGWQTPVATDLPAQVQTWYRRRLIPNRGKATAA